MKVVTSTAAAAAAVAPPVLPNNSTRITTNNVSIVPAGPKDMNSNGTAVDILMINSPALVRRTLHNQDDTVVAATSISKYEESMLAASSCVKK